MPILNPTVVSCCSFKGGAGRSTAAANIAAALMIEGKHVLLLDMDFGAPGLHEILRVCKLELYTDAINNRSDRSMHGLQHLFQEFENHEGNNTNYVKWFFSNRVFRLRQNISAIASPAKWSEKIEKSEGELFYIPSSPQPPETNEGEKRAPSTQQFFRIFQHIVKELKSKINPKMNFDFIIIDSASGISDRSTPVHGLSNIILMFYRQSLQHSFGTVSMAKRFYNYRRISPKWKQKEFLFIPSCVMELESLPLSPAMAKQVSEYRQQSMKAFDQLPEGFGDVSDLSVRDDDSLRVFERLVMNEQNMPIAKDYLKIARYLIQKREK